MSEKHDEAWHPATISANVEQVMRQLLGVPLNAPFYLAGGTGLALQIGHRRSVDLDFFLGEDFDVEILLQKLQRLDGFSLISKSPGTLYATIANVKVSFMAYEYPVLFAFRQYLGTNVADRRDIGCMKISAIASRGTKRDFVDLNFLAKQYGLDQLLGWFEKKFLRVNHSRLHVLKSLAYFEDAEKEPMPDMLVASSWEEVKRFFTHQVGRLL